MLRNRDDIILVVDDHPDSRVALTKLLGFEGFAAKAAESGREALAAARRDKPALIVMDHLMPDMTGLDVLRHLKSDPDTADVPVLFYTATSPADARTQALELGARDWCLKASLAWPDLLRIIEQFCGHDDAAAASNAKELEETRC